MAEEGQPYHAAAPFLPDQHSVDLFQPARSGKPNIGASTSMNESHHTIKIMIRGDQVALRPKNASNEKVKFEGLPLMKDQFGEEVLKLFMKLIQEDQIKSQNDFKLIGKLLYQALFTKKVSDGFQDARSLVGPSSQKRLRVELEFQKDDNHGLSRLPWEYLCYQDSSGKWDFVATVAELVLMRCLEPKAIQPRAVNFDPEKINVLLVILNPEPDSDGLGDLDVVEEGVRKALDKFKKCYSSH